MTPAYYLNDYTAIWRRAISVNAHLGKEALKLTLSAVFRSQTPYAARKLFPAVILR
jgi:hypothetical protein